MSARVRVLVAMSSDLFCDRFVLF